ncbi:MAG: hypothetical protein FJ026_13975 [Chloroflexi bacterium]|nr:hypothetical protein [Chloroflexota bacterium]
MERAIVTVKRQGEAWVRDLEVPTDVEATRLVELIAETLRLKTDAAGQPVEYELEAHPPGRKLKPDETLHSAGVWDGSWLVLKPIGRVAPDQPLPPTTQGSGPVMGWRPLGVDLPGQAPSQEQLEGQPMSHATERGSGFVWEQLD